jgi:hypothetical protein
VMSATIRVRRKEKGAQSEWSGSGVSRTYPEEGTADFRFQPGSMWVQSPKQAPLCSGMRLRGREKT